jgi:hypothetical protein
MDTKIALLNECIGPHAGNKFFFGDQLTGTLGESREYFKRATSKVKRLAALQQHPLFKKQTIGPKS